jgi:calcium-dependent protein kinase
MKKLTTEQKAELKKRFDYYDKNHNGYVSIAECREILKDYLGEDEIKEFFVKADLNKNGKITKAEFNKI